MTDKKTEKKTEKPQDKTDHKEPGKDPAAKKTDGKTSGKKKAGEGVSYTVQANRPRGSLFTPRLQTFYNDKVIPNLMKEFNFKNKMEVPRVTKVVVSACWKEALQNPKVIDTAVDEIAMITGQKPIVTKAKKSIAAFKLREGQAIGVAVTLRKAQMFEFLDRLLNIALPRVRDFRGVNSKSFDGRGNYSMGIKEQIIFPEINYDKVDKIRGLNITIVTSAKKNEHARSMLTHLGMPFKKA